MDSEVGIGLSGTIARSIISAMATQEALMKPISLFFAPFFFCLAFQASAAPTTLVVNPLNDGEAYQADYSQGLLLSAALTDAEGTAVAGERVTFQLVQRDDTSTQFTIADPITDAQGIATARITFVNGRFGGQTFPSATPQGDDLGFAYTVKALFLGDANALGCEGTPVENDTTLCESNAENELYLLPEVTQLTIQGGIEVALGESTQLVVRLSDQNGNAPEAGTDIDGQAPLNLADQEIAFFYDVDGNGRPELNELLGSSTTNSDGVATFDFLADPTFARAANIENGIHAQYGGDDFYTLAGASQDALIFVGEAVAESSLISATQNGVALEEVFADGFTMIDIRGTLVDAFGNLYDEEADPQLVEFTTTLGGLEGNAERDPVDGTYNQKLRAPGEGGTATVTLVVNGQAGSSVDIEFNDPPGCTCKSTNTPLPFFLLPAFALMAFVRRRKRERQQPA